MQAQAVQEAMRRAQMQQQATKLMTQSEQLAKRAQVKIQTQDQRRALAKQSTFSDKAGKEATTLQSLAKLLGKDAKATSQYVKLANKNTKGEDLQAGTRALTREQKAELKKNGVVVDSGDNSYDTEDLELQMTKLRSYGKTDEKGKSVKDLKNSSRSASNAEVDEDGKPLTNEQAEENILEVTEDGIYMPKTAQEAANIVGQSVRDIIENPQNYSAEVLATAERIAQSMMDGALSMVSSEDGETEGASENTAAEHATIDMALSGLYSAGEQATEGLARFMGGWQSFLSSGRSNEGLTGAFRHVGVASARQEARESNEVSDEVLDTVSDFNDMNFDERTLAYHQLSSSQPTTMGYDLPIAGGDGRLDLNSLPEGSRLAYAQFSSKTADRNQQTMARLQAIDVENRAV